MDPTPGWLLAGGVGALLGALVAQVLAGRARRSEREAGARARAEAALWEERALRGEEALTQERRRSEEARSTLAAAQASNEARERQFEEQRHMLQRAEERLSESFRAVGADALEANNRRFVELAGKSFEKWLVEAAGKVAQKQEAIDALLQPIRHLLEKQQTALGELEKKREVAYTGLEAHIQRIADSHEKLGAETGRLVSALRRPEQRGRWGEMQLRNVVELAGMTEHCDFSEQPQTDDPSTRDRPDMIVHMPGGAVIVVDAKVALDAYLDGLEVGADVAERKRAHARQVQQHVDRLAAKRYWEQFDVTPRLVVLFMPLESALNAALEVQPDLHADAMQKHVLIATPTLLVALLRAVAYGWQQDIAATNAREITSVAHELHGRIRKFVEHFERAGSQMGAAVRAYNAAVGSLERNLLTSARRLRGLSAAPEEDVSTPDSLAEEVRPITSSELLSPPEEQD
jgi:DNA recombination protein RmuC